MSEFWKSVVTMQAERGGNYHAYPLFGASHLTELAVSAAFIFIVCVWYYHAAEHTRRKILAAVTALMIIDEAAKYVAMVATGQWGWVYLPLHLCSINLFVCLFNTLFDFDWCKEELYALCIPGAVAALLCPGWQSLPVWNFMHLHSQTVHVLLVLYPALLLVGGFRPSVKRAPQALAFLFGTALPIYYLNKVIDTNFYFLNEPYSNVITILFTKWFGEEHYIIGFLPAVALMMLIMYLPWVVVEKTKKKNTI